MPCPFLIVSQSDSLIQIVDIHSHSKWQKCISRSVSFFRSRMIWIYTVCKRWVYLGSAGQGLKSRRMADFHSNWTQSRVFHTVRTILQLYSFWSCWALIYLAFANSIDPDQLASEEANWSGSVLFAIQYVNLYQQSGLSNLIGWKLEVGVATSFIQHDKG